MSTAEIKKNKQQMELDLVDFGGQKIYRTHHTAKHNSEIHKFYVTRTRLECSASEI